MATFDPEKLHFDFRDILRAPRLALSGKKVWLMMQANLVGYAVYLVFAFLALLANGMSIAEAFGSYGLYPCLIGRDAGPLAWVLWSVGLLAGLSFSWLGYAAVARVTFKELKGDIFYSMEDTWKFVCKHWEAVLGGSLVLVAITAFFVVFAVLFALVGRIPYLGELFFGIPYAIWFIGSAFVVYTLVVLGVSFFFSHAVVGTMDEDAMGVVFQSYSFTWSQPWRIVTYLSLTAVLMYAGWSVALLFGGWTAHLIGLVFGQSWLMGDKLDAMMGWAASVVQGPNRALDCLTSLTPFECGPWTFPPASGTLGPVGTIGGFFIAVAMFALLAAALSYVCAIESVSETIAALIFKKRGDNVNLLEMKDEEEREATRKEKAEKEAQEKSAGTGPSDKPAEEGGKEDSGTPSA